MSLWIPFLENITTQKQGLTKYKNSKKGKIIRLQPMLIRNLTSTLGIPESELFTGDNVRMTIIHQEPEAHCM